MAFLFLSRILSFSVKMLIGSHVRKYSIATLNPIYITLIIHKNKARDDVLGKIS